MIDSPNEHERKLGEIHLSMMCTVYLVLVTSLLTKISLVYSKGVMSYSSCCGALVSLIGHFLWQELCKRHRVSHVKGTAGGRVVSQGTSGEKLLSCRQVASSWVVLKALGRRHCGQVYLDGHYNALKQTSLCKHLVVFV